MKIEIKHRHTGNIILCGEYESIKSCLEKNRDADLGGAYLRGRKKLPILSRFLGRDYPQTTSRNIHQKRMGYDCGDFNS